MFRSKTNPKDRFAAIFVAALTGLVLVIDTALNWQLANAMTLVFAAIAIVLLIRLRRELFTRQDVRQSQLTRMIDSYQSPLASIKPRRPLPAMRVQGAWAATPDFASLIVDTILEMKPATIVELGSGASTLAAGYALELTGSGRIYSLDHEQEFAEKTRDSVRNHGLGDIVSVITAPLKDYSLGGENWPWYDIEALGELDAIDLVVVDGPPDVLREHARYPALPLLHDKLSERAVIILDDSIRESERNIVEKWMKEYPGFSTEYVETEKGTYLLRRQSAMPQ